MASYGTVFALSLVLMVCASIIASASNGKNSKKGPKGWCLENTYVNIINGTFITITFKRTQAGKQAKTKCPNGKCAYRNCNLSVQWEYPDLNGCQFFQNVIFGKGKKNKTNKGNDKAKAQQLKHFFKLGSPKHKTKKNFKDAVTVLEEIVLIKDKLNETALDILETINAIMDMNKTTLAESGNTSSKILRILDLLAENIPTDEQKKTKVLNASNLVLQAIDVNKTSFNGVPFGVSSKGTFSENSEKAKTSVKLPSSLLGNTEKQSVRIGFIYYGNNKLFQEKVKQQKNDTTSQAVLSSSVYNVSTSNLSDPVVLKFQRQSGTAITNKSCVFWNEKARKWSNFGCSLCPKQTSDKSVECCCNHLTSFAVLFSLEKTAARKDEGVHDKILSIISYVGCAISLICVFLTFLTYLIFRHLRKTNQQPILMNLCIAIALLLIVFVAGINSTNNTLACQIVAVLLHYLTLVTVLWMGIEAYNLYLQIVKVMAIYQRKFMLKAAIVGWGVPLIIVLATVIAATVEYNQDKSLEKTFKYGSDYACVLHNQLYSIIAWFVPILAILLFNLVIFISVIYHLRHSLATADTKTRYKKQFWTALAIMCLLGLTWLFGALAISDARIVFEYLFCIFNSLQGFFIFFFHCVRVKEVRSQWSLFVSGLGFSRAASESSQSGSKKESQYNDTPYSKIRDWISRRHSDPPKRAKRHDSEENKKTSV